MSPTEFAGLIVLAALLALAGLIIWLLVSAFGPGATTVSMLMFLLGFSLRR